MIGVMMIQNGYVIKKIWILVETSSTDTIKKLYCVSDVKNCARHRELIVFMNRGLLIFYRKGHLNFFTFECTRE